MMNPTHPYLPIFHRLRGDIEESIHYGAAAVVNTSGELLAWYGNPRAVTFLRSSAKPFQALPLVEKGGIKAFSISPKELALICASHSGTPQHQKTLENLQKKIGLSQEDLMCGTHYPFHQETRRSMICSQARPTPNHHNCSGKHTGMLAQAKLLQTPLDNYPEKEHAVQQIILRCMAEMAVIDQAEIGLGRDGCSVPTFALPLYHAAWAWARLVDPRELKNTRARACQHIVQAMTHHPDMVAGPERFDTRLMRAAGGKLVSKAGAEAYQALGIPKGILTTQDEGVGVAIKISAGDQGKKARGPVTLEILRQLDILSPEEQKELEDIGPRYPITNQRDFKVGVGEPIFRLNFQ